VTTKRLREWVSPGAGLGTASRRWGGFGVLRHSCGRYEPPAPWAFGRTLTINSLQTKVSIAEVRSLPLLAVESVGREVRKHGAKDAKKDAGSHSYREDAPRHLRCSAW